MLKKKELKPSTNEYENAFSKSEIFQVWNKGAEINGFSRVDWRRDICGAVMKFEEYGNRNSKYGWEIDHIKPKFEGGTDELMNLQPLHWENNNHKGNNYPIYACKIPTNKRFKINI